MVSKEALDITKKFIEAIKRAGIKIDQAYIFGSFVRGTANKWSDIDIAIISKDFKKDRYKWGVELSRIAWKVDSRIEPIPFETKSFAVDNWVPLIYEIKSHGVPVEIAA